MRRVIETEQFNFRVAINTVDCPRCNAPSGKGCKTPNGSMLRPPHVARTEAYKSVASSLVHEPTSKMVICPDCEQNKIDIQRLRNAMVWTYKWFMRAEPPRQWEAQKLCRIMEGEDE